MGKLTAAGVNAIKKPGRYGDGLGLWLQVTRARTKSDPEAITKSWLFRFMRDGRARQMGLGPLHTVGLADARQRAQEARRMLLDGIDPIEARQAQRAAARLEAAKGLTFRAAADRFIKSHEVGWRNPKHRDQWRNTLATYAYPIFGDLPVAAIDTGLVLKALEPIWRAKPETATRVRGRIESVLNWAAARGYRSGENPARWRGHLDKLLPARARVRRIKHHAALPWPELPAFMGELRGRDGLGARALEFAILTAARTGEVIGARRLRACSRVESSILRRMPFDPSRYPDALTIGRLVELGLPLAVHCHRCGRAAVFDADAFGLPLATYVPALGGRFRCTRCGSRSTEAQPEYARPAAGPGATAWGKIGAWQ